MNDNFFACGVYAMECTVNGRQYIGSTINAFVSRALSHYSALNNNTHNNQELQEDWNEHGAHSFRFVILQEFDMLTPMVEIRKAEQSFIDAGIDLYNRKSAYQEGSTTAYRIYRNGDLRVHTDSVRDWVNRGFSREKIFKILNHCEPNEHKVRAFLNRLLGPEIKPEAPKIEDQAPEPRTTGSRLLARAIADAVRFGEATAKEGKPKKQVSQECKPLTFTSEQEESVRRWLKYRMDRKWIISRLARKPIGMKQGDASALIDKIVSERANSRNG